MVAVEMNKWHVDRNTLRLQNNLLWCGKAEKRQFLVRMHGPDHFVVHVFRIPGLFVLQGMVFIDSQS
jgi:hypothetical protein